MDQFRKESSGLFLLPELFASSYRLLYPFLQLFLFMLFFACVCYNINILQQLANEFSTNRDRVCYSEGPQRILVCYRHTYSCQHCCHTSVHSHHFQHYIHSYLIIEIIKTFQQSLLNSILDIQTQGRCYPKILLYIF